MLGFMFALCGELAGELGNYVLPLQNFGGLAWGLAGVKGFIEGFVLFYLPVSVSMLCRLAGRLLGRLACLEMLLS